jgi:hypothetical protein
VWTTHDAVGHNNREGTLALDELKYLAGDGHVRAHVASFNFQSRISAGSASSDGMMPYGHLGGPA